MVWYGKNTKNIVFLNELNSICELVYLEKQYGILIVQETINLGLT